MNQPVTYLAAPVMQLVNGFVFGIGMILAAVVMRLLFKVGFTG